jgi:hypothetical protein
MGVDWINLAENTDEWRAPLNMVMNIRAENKGKYECMYDIGGKARRKETTRKT